MKILLLAQHFIPALSMAGCNALVISMICIMYLCIAYSPGRQPWLSRSLHVILSGRNQFSHQSPAVAFGCVLPQTVGHALFWIVSLSSLSYLLSLSIPVFLTTSCFLALTADIFRKMDSIIGHVLLFFSNTCLCPHKCGCSHVREPSFSLHLLYHFISTFSLPMK